MRSTRKQWLASSVAGLAFLIGTTAAQSQSDITSPGDPIIPSSGNAPAAEGAANAIDNLPATKYLNFDKLNTGFTVTPSQGPRSIVTGIALTSANDAPERDPASYTLEGSLDGINWAPISAGPVAPFAARFTRQQIDFANAAAYSRYRVIFPTIVDAVTANSMQVAEVELIGTAVTPTGPYITSASSALNPNAIYLTFDRWMGASATNPVSYAVDNGIVVSGAAYGASSNVVVLNVSGTPLVYNTTYTITATGVQDASGNATDPNPSIYSFKHGDGVVQGTIVRRLYLGIGGGAVADLTGSPKFPCSPDEVDPAVPAFEYGTNPARNNNGRGDTENYGASLQGLFVAPATGNYRFGLAADDGAALYLSTDASPANKVLLTSQTGWNATREYVTPASGGTSPPLSPVVALEAGKSYYMEGLFKEGGGGDHIAVAVQTPGGPEIVNGQEPIAASLFAPNVYWADCGRAPFTYFGAVSLVQNIADQAVLEADTVRFQVLADGSPNYTYQWYSNNVPIAGATSANYSFVARPSANGAQYKVVVQNAFSSVTSATATLSVTPTPRVADVGTRLDGNAVYVAFTKPVRALEALDAASYLVTNSSGGAVAISGITYLGGSNQTVRLAVASPLPLNSSYGIVISEIRDMDGNIMTPNPTVAQFTHGAGVNAPQGLTRKIYLGIGGTAVTDLTGNAKYPCAPDETDPNIPNFEYGTNPAINNQGRGNTENYGIWIYGVFQPEVTGNYQFGLAADDGAALYLSTDATPANKVLLTSQGSWNAAREYVTAPSGGSAVPLSPVVQLEAGKRYYMEGLCKEGGGGDHIEVAVRKPGDPPIANGQAGIPRSLFATNYSIGCPPTAFFSTLGPVFLTQQPTNNTVNELAPATFQVAVDGAPPYSIQWYSNNVPVAGATGSRYVFNPYRYANDADYYAIVQNGFSAITSSVVKLTVISDNVAPVATRARGSQSMREAVLTFSEPLDLSTATNIANYTITNSSGAALAITGVRSISASNVVLTTAVQSQGERYSVVMNGILDRAGVQNAIAANSVVQFSGFVFTPGFALMETYATGGGNNVIMLRTNANYPYFPRDRYFITRMNSRLGYPTDANEAYGGRISGLFIPPTNGNYTILFSSDDDGEFVGSADENPANVAVTVPLPGCCAAWGAAGRQTPPLPLTAGNRYYYELLWKEGTGGDYAGGTLDPAEALPGQNVRDVGIPSSMLGLFANPDDTAIYLTQGTPAVINTVPNQYLGFTVAATNTAQFPQSYQWQKWDPTTMTFTNIPGAVGADASTLIYGPTSTDDNGSQIRVIAYAPGVSVTSVSTINVNPDTVGPRLIAASGDGSFEKVLLTFNEPMDTSETSELREAFYYVMSDGVNEIYFNAVQILSPTNVLITVDPSTGVMLEGTTYTVTAQEGLKDANGNAIDLAFNTAPFTSWVRTPLMTKYDIYTGIGGGVVNDLLNNARYPNQPTTTFYTNSLDWPQTSPDLNDYGLRMSGYFRPPVSGNYTFYIKNDDAARFQLSTDQSAANLRTIIDVGCCNGSFAGASTVNGLVAGNAYYFEAIVKEAGGGDYLTIGVRPPGSATVVPVDGVYLTNAINSALVSINPGIATQPQSFARVEGGSATLTVVVTNVGAFGATYQWQSDTGTGFTDIPGATGSSFNTGALPLSANGTQYRVLVYAPGKMLTSAVATATITPDTTKPTVVSAGSANGTQVGVRFSEPVTQISAEEELNYNIGGVLPTSATLRPDGSTVVLIFDTPVAREFTLSVENINDLASTPNTVIATNINGKWWNDTVVDIGAPNPVGTHFSAAEGEIEITAGGNDVWGTSDQFTYAYSPQANDFDVRVRVDSLQYVGNAWSKAGLNIRESTNANSKMIWFYPTPTQGANAFEGGIRPNDGADVADFGQPRPAVYFPAWLRATRNGSVFTAYLSQDGTNWNAFGMPQNAPQFPSTVLVGVGMVSHVDGVAGTAVFSKFSLVPDANISVSGGNLVITWPGGGTLQSAPTVNGPWTDVVGATSPYTTPNNQPMGFYRILLPAGP